MFDTYDENQPVIVGLAGPPGAGKTSTANYLRPLAMAEYEYEVDEEDLDKHIEIVRWDHLWCAMPLYELASIRTKVSGVNQQSRQLHQIHDVLRDVFRMSIDYDDMVELAYDIYSLPIREDGGKPRSFLQQAGSLMRAYDPDCFAKWVVNKSQSNFRERRMNEHDTENTSYVYITVVSDVRYLNEATLISQQRNSMLIYLDVSDQEAKARLLDRDGFVLSSEELSHESEADRQTEEFMRLFNIHIETDNLSPKEQGESVKFAILDYVHQTSLTGA